MKFKKLISENKLLIFTALFFSFIHLNALYLLENISLAVYLTSLVCIPLRFLIIKHIQIKTKLSQLAVWLFLECSFPLHYFLISTIQNSHKRTLFPFILGNSFLILFFILVLIFSLFKIEKINIKDSVDKTIDPKRGLLFIISLAITAFIFSIISFKLGITKMGLNQLILPYKLEPLLNLSRNVSIPIVFILSLHFFKNIKRYQYSIFTIYLFWLITEMVIRGSRGIVLTGMLPVIIYLVKTIKIKQLITTLTLFFVITFSLFFIGENIRYKNMNLEQKTDISLQTKIWTFYSRVFNGPMIFDDFKSYFNSPFFANRILLLKKEGGANVYYTKRVTNLESPKAHSQGLTALSDGFIHFGLLGSFFTLTFIFLCAYLNDYGQIPILNNHLATQSLGIYGIINWLIWGEGIWDFYLNRSLFTISVFPLTLIIMGRLIPFFIFKKEIASDDSSAT